MTSAKPVRQDRVRACVRVMASQLPHALGTHLHLAQKPFYILHYVTVLYFAVAWDSPIQSWSLRNAMLCQLLFVQGVIHLVLLQKLPDHK